VGFMGAKYGPKMFPEIKEIGSPKQMIRNYDVMSSSQYYSKY